jgi:capsular exopolysaccharide synthesis family protein
MRRKVEASEEALQQYAARNGLHFSTDRGEAISEDGLRQVQADLLHARTDLMQKQARRQLAEAAKADSLADVDKDPDLRELRAKLDDLHRQEAELLTIYKPSYSEVLKVQAQADEVERALAQAKKRVVGRVLDEYKESSQTESLLSSAYRDALAKAAAESQTAIQYDILKREADANLTAYQDMLAKVKELSLATAFRSSNVRIIDPAEPPKRPNSPKLPMNLALGLCSGLMLGIGYALVSERSNPSLRHPGEAMMRLGIPELATIPNLDGPFAGHFALPPPTQDPDANSSLSILRDQTMEEDESTMDAFRTLLTSILFSSARGKHPKVVVVTSAAGQEGKTTVACNLAIALARAGKTVLLVDGDLRKPALHRKFSLPNMIGLGNLLQAGCDSTDAQFAVLQTSVNRLSVLPSGSFSSAPADLLFQPNLHALMNSYREHFDMIVIDSPPLVGVPDARLLGRAADGVVLVARANKTSRGSLVTACHRLGLDHSRVLGVVLNDWNGQHSPYPS